MAPTLRSLCVFASLLSTTLAGSWKQPALPLYDLSPSNTGSAALPTPTTQAKYIALGIGFQNYTCATLSTPSSSYLYTQAQPSDGAVANLYDITANATSCNIEYLSAEALSRFEYCIQTTGCATGNSDQNCSYCQSVAINYIRSRGVSPAPQIGQHYFTTINGSQTPNFRVKSDFLSAKKVGDVKAPANSSTGVHGYGAVDWLYLPKNAYGLSHGLSAVYRVETSGGSAPVGCYTLGAQTYQPYVAEYWFYA